MRILVLANSIDGVVKFRLELLKELVNTHEVHLSIPDFGRYEITLSQLGIKLHKTKINRRGMNPFEDFKTYKDYRKLISDVNPDKVLTYTIKPNIYGGIASTKQRVEFIPTITGLGSGFVGLKSTLVKFLYKLSLKKAEKVVFQNIHNLDFFVKSQLVSTEKSVLVNGSGINIDHFEFLEKNYSSLNILFVGRIMKEKGIDLFLELARKLSSDKITFSLIGDIEEDVYEKELNSLIEKGKLTYLGYKDEMSEVYGSFNVLVHPSYHEGMSNVLLEAGYSGLTLMASNIPGCKEIVLDKDLLFEIDDIDGYSDSILALYEKENHELLEDSRKQSDYIKREFDRRKIVKKYIDMLTEGKEYV